MRVTGGSDDAPSRLSRRTLSNVVSPACVPPATITFSPATTAASKNHAYQQQLEAVRLQQVARRRVWLRGAATRAAQRTALTAQLRQAVQGELQAA